MSERIIGYARVSTELQSNDSQIERITQFAQDNGMTLETVFSVIGSSEISNKTMDEALEYLQSNEIKRMVVYNRSRISRIKEETERIEATFAAEGKEIFFLEEQRDRSIDPVSFYYKCRAQDTILNARTDDLFNFWPTVILFATFNFYSPIWLIN